MFDKQAKAATKAINKFKLEAKRVEARAELLGIINTCFT